MSKNFVSTLIGVLAGFDFIFLVVFFKMAYFPDFVFSDNPLHRFIVLILFFIVISYVRNYLRDNSEDESFSGKKKITVIIVLIIFILCLVKMIL